ncbi:MAG TPA: putative toxin-antitoxin system toxin component, PIN family [Lentisphaeria bacterium]|nr:MAG: putative toxin-antitoxin system toxin component, PIN family [Lentisphaerae bacterium GWF2_49_21]HBC88167.1 putative toxin-antitoxin system toxin component, PIN family [Lentisphaeria bacterium]
MKIVLDTNVLVSGLLTPFGTSGNIVRMLTSGKITLCLDARILLEYDEVLHRPHFGIDPQKTVIVLEHIRHTGQVYAAVPLDSNLPDIDDNPFLEIAISSGAECLITGNLKHFPKELCGNVHICSPGQFLDTFRKRKSK